MKITLQLQGPLRKYGGDRDLHYLVLAEEQLTIQQLLMRMGVPASSLAFVSVNGHKQPLQYRLQGGDEVTVFPRVSGG